MATTNTQKDENHIKFSDQNQPAVPAATRIEDLFSDNSASATLEQPPISVIDLEPPGKDGSESKTVGDPTEASLDSMAADNSAPISDIQKKMRRAERFGMPVQLSEEEKRNSRAERFGTRSSTNGSDALKKSEEQKRKARADRFGLVQSMPAEEEAKKKARIARFGTISKTDSLEEEKKKARAIRFSQQPSSSLSQVSDKGNIELKTVIAGKAGGGL